MPLPAGTLLTSMSTLTSVPDFQYDFGRQCASLSVIQCHDARCAGVDLTTMCFSKAALFWTATSKVAITGMPTPTVSPCSGATDG